MTAVTAAIGDTAALACRASLREADEETEGRDPLIDELTLRRAKVGADSAYAAADRAFLPSLADFLH